MDGERKYDEESLQHIYALLQKHDIPDILRMALDITKSRPTSLRLVRDAPARLPLYRSGLNPTKPAPALALAPTSTSSPISEAFSPADSVSLASPLPLDYDSRSITSSGAKRSTNTGTWFCTFCPDLKSFAAKADWKKHETRHHETGEDWPCPIRNCFQVFDRELDFKEHCERHHPDVPPPTDIKTGNTPTRSTISSVRTPRELPGNPLFSDLESKEPRYQITWNPSNTRVLKQKLECSDMRPGVDMILHTALSLRSGRPFNDAVDLDPDFRTPSQDSVPHFNALTGAELTHILSGRRTQPLPGGPRSPLTSHPSESKIAFRDAFREPHPGELVAFDIPSPTISHRRVSYMDIDSESFNLIDEPDPQIPPGLDLDPFQMDSGSPKPFQIYYPQAGAVDGGAGAGTVPRRSSRGHIFRHLKGRKAGKQETAGGALS
ncbi:hypothetical protein N0V90_007626 [Kalmusia sp. IMI 367209]|nr:hypothetical protein N0V90_007626 [Kalmusia sp. IMI 367209]